MHQKTKHFKCDSCKKKLSTAGGMVVHCMQVHKVTVISVPNAKPGRDDVNLEIYGMEGVPIGALAEHPAAKKPKPPKGIGIPLSTNPSSLQATNSNSGLAPAFVPPPPGLPPKKGITPTPPGNPVGFINPSLPPQPMGTGSGTSPQSMPAFPNNKLTPAEDRGRYTGLAAGMGVLAGMGSQHQKFGSSQDIPRNPNIMPSKQLPPGQSKESIHQAIMRGVLPPRSNEPEQRSYSGLGTIPSGTGLPDTQQGGLGLGVPKPLFPVGPNPADSQRPGLQKAMAPPGGSGLGRVGAGIGGLMVGPGQGPTAGGAAPNLQPTMGVAAPNLQALSPIEAAAELAQQELNMMVFFSQDDSSMEEERAGIPKYNILHRTRIPY